MKNQFYLCLCFILLSFNFSSCQPQLKNEKEAVSEHKNKLSLESSPYLLQHATNPVNWLPWGTEALEKSKRENKPLLISIGYAACHWCHVMEKESFTDTPIAGFMNRYFVPVKVDREERPDVDQIYMDALQLISGNGGWPLNAFALPDGKPFYVGTYYSPAEWKDLLLQIHEAYSGQPDKVRQQAEDITQGIASQKIVNETKADPSRESLKNICHSAFASLKNMTDWKQGGLNKTPKFPLPASWEFLLQYHYLTGNKDALDAVTLTLDKMAMGGIYDQIGGGFARYSTDKEWKVPHFEKMLYDNAQLISLYSHAYQVTKNVQYKKVIEETLSFVERELTHTDGGFYSSLNADSEGEEGKYYVWQKQETDKIFDKKTALLVNDYFHILESGNWENNNILYLKLNKERFIRKHNFKAEDFEKDLDEWKKKLLKEREKRIRPSTDDKVLTAWNALMLKGYIDAYKALKEEKYLNIALRNATFLKNEMIQKDGALFRNFKSGKVSIPAFLDDYALLTEAFIELYQITFDISWLNQAKTLTEYTIKHFYDPETGMFFYTSDQAKDLVVRSMEIEDNVTPASNFVMANNLFDLSLYYDKPDWHNISLNMLNKVSPQIASYAPYYAVWAKLAGKIGFGMVEVAITGAQSIENSLQLQTNFLPNGIFMGGTIENLPLLINKVKEGKSSIYVCQNKVCKMPVNNWQEALKLINIKSK